MLRLVELLEPVPSQYLKKLIDTGGLWEARAQHGGETFRLIAFLDGPQFIVVSGFSKKIPREELEVAEARRQDYLSRRSSNERSH